MLIFWAGVLVGGAMGLAASVLVVVVLASL